MRHEIRRPKVSGLLKQEAGELSPAGHAFSARRRPGYSLLGCFPAEPNFAWPGDTDRNRTAQGRQCLWTPEPCLQNPGGTAAYRPCNRRERGRKEKFM